MEKGKKLETIRLMAIPLLAVLMGIAFLLPVSAGAASSQTAAAQANTTCSNTKTCPVTGTVTNKAGQTIGTFNGTLTITKFTPQNGQVVAHGKLSGTVTNTAGQVTQTISNKAVTVPVAIDPTCSVLSLTLGPLDLSLLGLNIHLNQVVLTITANSSQGILGQLLCSLAGTPPSSLSTIVSLLNQILALLP